MRSIVLGAVVFSLTAASGCAAQRGAAPSAAPPPPAPLAAADPAPDDRAEPDDRAPEPEHHGPWVSAATSSDYVLAHQSDQMFGVWVDVPRGAATGHVPTALTLAIDTSGSMRGDDIVHARDAARRLLQELEAGDRVSIVTFSGRARVLVPPTELTEPNRRHLLDVVEELSAHGGTAMHAGLKVAESQLWSTPDTHLVRRLVVISDGKATVGPSSPDELGRVAEVGLQRSIQVTSIGVGLDYDETTLNALAIRSGGRLYHVEHGDELPTIVEQEIALLESTAAAGAEVEIVPAPGVTLVGTDTAHMRWSQRKLVVPIGTMFAGQQRELLVRARIDGRSEGSQVIASVRLHFQDPGEDGVPRVQEAVLRATMTDDPSLVAAHRNSRADTLIAMREATVFAQQASRASNSGDLDRADDELARAQKRLEEQAQRAETKGERRRVERSAARIRRSRKDLAKAKGASAPARATAGRKAALDLNDVAMEAKGY